MAYTLRSKDNAGDMGRAADQNESVDNDIYFNSLHAAAVSAWLPDKPPASPNALDDEFEDSSLAGAWTEYDADGKTVWSEDVAGLKGTLTSVAGYTVNGLYKDLPAGDFTIWGKFGLAFRDDNNYAIGLNLWENPAGDNKHFAFYIWEPSGGISNLSIKADEFTNRTTVGSAKVGASAVGHGTSLYLRMRRNAANYYLDYSFDGWSWGSAAGSDAAYTLTFTPTKVGICVPLNTTATTQYVRCQFFRYVGSDVGLSGAMSGNR